MNAYQKYLLEKEIQEIETKLQTAEQNRQWLADDKEKLQAEVAELKNQYPQARSQVQITPVKTIHDMTQEEVMQNYKKHGDKFIKEISAKIEADPDFQQYFSEVRSHLPQAPISSIKETSPEEILKAMKSSDNISEALKALGAA